MWGDVHKITSLGYEPPVFPHYQHLLISRRSEEELKRLVSEIPDEIAYNCMAIGDEEQCIKKIEELADVGATHIAIIDVLSAIRSRKTIEKIEKIINTSKIIKSKNVK